jgi:hypothetical protein
MKIFKKILSLIVGQSTLSAPKPTAKASGKYTERQLIELESKIGREVFGNVLEGRRREFFCLDEHTWVWHEEWFDSETKQPQMTTIRYEIRGNGVLKVVGHTYKYIEGQELDNLYRAIKIYYQRVMGEIYQHPSLALVK